MENEIWKPVVGYEGLYEVSNQGKVISLNYNKTGKVRLLRLKKTRKGYLQVCLHKDGKKNSFQVHRLVWEAFNGPVPEGMQINHISERKDQNNLENLNLMAPKDNCNYGTRNERISKPVEQYTLSGIYLCTWPSIISVGRELGHLGFRHGNICLCCQGKRKTHKGYIWKYAD